MSGNRYLLDTNAIVALLAQQSELTTKLSDAVWVGISIISQLEISVFDGLTSDDRLRLQAFQQQVDIIGLTTNEPLLLQQIVNVRRKYRFKLPDAIIVATAITTDATLVTADAQLKRVQEISVFDFSHDASSL
jgi:tRNA(fMet)-specific endonuclease VapC